MRRILFTTLILSTLLLVAFGNNALAQAPAGEVSCAGSTTVQPIAEKFAEAFMAVYPDVKIDVAGGGSSVGVKSAGTGAADIGMASRVIKDSEYVEYPELNVYTIAMDGIAIVVNPKTEVSELTKEQVKDIFAGKIANWNELGGADATIAVIAREEGSGTRAAFEELVMGEEDPIVASILLPSNGAVRTAVAETEDSIGFLSFGYLDDTIKALSIAGVAPTVANASSGVYPVVRPLNMMTYGQEPKEAAVSFINWILGPVGQSMVKEEGYLPVLPENALSGNLSIAGSTTVQPLAEIMSEAFMFYQPGVKIDVAGGGSSVGVKSAGTGAADIGMASRVVKDTELQEYAGMQVHTIALDGIAVVVNPNIEMNALTKDQVRDVFAGTITNWNEVGGPDAAIAVIAREEGSGTRAAFEELVMGEGNPIVAGVLLPSNGAVRTAVAETADAIGFVSLGYLDDTIKALAIDGVAPTAETAASGEYPVVRPLNMMTMGDGSDLAQAFIAYILSPNGQRIVAGEGYIPVK